MNLTFLQVFNPCSDALLREVSQHVSDPVIVHIAKADYEMDAEKNLRELREIRNGKPLKKPLPWSPKEVLELTRWSEPEGENWPEQSRGLSRADGHMARAFSCAVLMRAYGDPETRDYCEGYNETLIQLMSSLEYVDFDYAQKVMSMLSWLILQLEDEPNERLFIAVALLFMAVKFDAGLSDEQFADFCSWVIAQEREMVAFWREGIGDFPDHWLLRTTHFNQKYAKWIALGEEMSVFELKGQGGEALRELGRCLAAANRMPRIQGNTAEIRL